MSVFFLFLLSCASRSTPGSTPASGSCTLRLATLPNSAWQELDVGPEQAPATLRFSGETVRYTRGDQSRIYSCAPEGEALRCATAPDVLTWCRARLASRRGCTLDEIRPQVPTLSEAVILETIRLAAEEHAEVAGTEWENAFVERYAEPEGALSHTLQLRPDPRQCQLQVSAREQHLDGGEWSERPSPLGDARFAPLIP
jgi:hypothetical protein